MTFSLVISCLLDPYLSRRNRKSVLNHQQPFEVCCRHLSKTTIHESSQGYFPLLSPHCLKLSVTAVFVHCISIQKLYKVSGRLDFWLSCYIGPSVFLIGDFLLLTTVTDHLHLYESNSSTNEYHCNSAQVVSIKDTHWNAPKYRTAASNEEREQIQIKKSITMAIVPKCGHPSHCSSVPFILSLGTHTLTSPTHSIKLPSILPPTQKTLLYRMHTLAGRQPERHQKTVARRSIELSKGTPLPVGTNEKNEHYS